MSYLGSWKIDDYLTFCCNTHDPDTGVATDADSVPTYRIYEDETSTPILTGSTAKLDDANTTGFYSERIQLTAANGFEKGKCYTIYISATVDSDTGTMHHNFQIEAEVDTNTASDLHADLDDGGRLDLLIDAIKAATDDLADGQRLDLLIDAIKNKTDNLPTDPADDSDIDAQLATIAGYLDTEVAAIKAQTDDLADGQRLDLLIDAIKAATDKLPADPADDSDIDAQLATIAGYLDTEIAAIKAQTDDLADGQRLDLILDAIKAATDDLPDGQRLDLLIDAIKAKTDNLPTDPADDSDIDAQLVTIAGYLDTEIADIQSRLPAALVSGRMSADAVAISGSTDAADRLEASALTIVTGTVNAGNTTPTTTLFAADDIVEATADHFIGRIVIFYDSGDALFRQATDIVDYEWDVGNSEAKFTVTALTEAPSDNDKFVIV